MKREFWLDKWKENQLGFHNEQTNELLLRFFEKLSLNDSSFVFVPLCGKSLDLQWFANKGHKVIGIELSEIAVKSFFEENKISYEVKEVGNLLKYCSDKIDIFLGDVFELTAEILGPIDLVYDRASMIALPEGLRIKYNQKLNELIDKETKILLITIEYDQNLVAGPPFSVTKEMIKIPGIEPVFEHTPSKMPPKFSQAGASIVEKVYIRK